MDELCPTTHWMSSSTTVLETATTGAIADKIDLSMKISRFSSRRTPSTRGKAHGYAISSIRRTRRLPQSAFPFTSIITRANTVLFSVRHILDLCGLFIPETIVANNATS
ncbi:hypothetical protein M413DRAFT_448880 [Hebeloma cylindrosporum]|uniref:Uncharacterized protein n=1 Tax=Hebeloma cylindrosporum TaxID=76867 RepID=A0A0C2Y6T5_HEBCY|nr:hypothetical protein M413DRAFT_450132 [Hebeloma cylindrosporum h7]KIM36742.1 hypothetical protein M413DRAFT_448880 [Hebeloma cylindrosporum h7]